MDEQQNRPVFDKLAEDLIKYIDIKAATTKLTLVENLSIISANALRVLILVVLCSIALVFFALAAFSWLAELLNSQTWAAIVIGGLFVTLGAVVFFIRAIFVNRMVKVFSKIIFVSRKKTIDYHDE